MNEDKKSAEEENPTLPVSPSDADPENQDESSEAPGKRSAEGRIGELLSKNKQLEEKLLSLESRVISQEKIPTPPVKPVVEETPEVRKAIEYLKETGQFVDQKDLQDKIKAMQDRMALDSEHARLEGMFDGGDGRPTYDRKTVEDFMRVRGIYDPEVAYKALHEAELFDWNIKKAEKDRKSKPFIAKPGSTINNGVDENTITREKIDGWLKSPEGRAKYEENREKILKLMAEGQL